MAITKAIYGSSSKCRLHNKETEGQQLTAQGCVTNDQERLLEAAALLLFELQHLILVVQVLLRSRNRQLKTVDHLKPTKNVMQKCFITE